MAEFCCRTLRGLGKYTGDLVIFTEGDHKSEYAKVIKTEYPPGRHSAYLARIWVRNFIDPSQYDWILYLDSDIAAFHDVNPLFDVSADAIYYQEGNLTWKHQGRCMDTEEWEIASKTQGHGINCGMLSIPSQMFMPLMDAWDVEVTHCRTCRQMARLMVDQNALNALRYRGVFPFKQFAPGSVQIVRAVNMRHMQRSRAGFDHRILHYVAYSKVYMLGCMTELYEQQVKLEQDGKRKPLEINQGT